MKKLLTIFLLTGAVAASAQYSIVGKVLNAADRSPVEMATVRLFQYQGNDSVMLQGVQADLEGAFVLSKVKQGRYAVLISGVGFVPAKKMVTVPADANNPIVNAGTFLLREDVQVLAAVDVKGHAAEMTVKGDTIEYNTSAYKVQDGAVVEDLLKKMNGVEVDREGNVTVNGENIKGIRIDGKKFFGNDVQSATKNIPAEMIDKIQVIDEKSDMAKLTGFEDDETERIINLSLKANKKKGVFGNFGGGLGADLVADNGKWFDYGNKEFGKTAADRTKHFFENDFRYNANVFTNILLGESQTTIIGGANNTNEIRTGRGRGGFGRQNQGVTWGENLGLNTNIDLTSKLKNPRPQASLLFGGDAQMNHSKNDSWTESTKDSYSKDGVTYHNADNSSKRSYAWDAKVRLELEYQVDSQNKLIFKPEFSYTRSEYTQHSDYRYTKDTNVVNDGYQDRFNLENAISATLKTIYSHKFLKPGRTLTINLDLGLSDTKSNGETFATDLLKGDTTVNQNTHSLQNAYNYGLKLSYVEPIYGRNHFLEFAASVNGKNRKSEKNQYKGTTRTLLDSTYSNAFRNDFYSETFELNYRWLEEKSDLSVGLKVNPSQTHTRTTYMDTQLTSDRTQSVWNFSPNVSFKYKFGKKEFARISYRGTTQQPSVSQMEPVRNNSNAMNETVGNLGLNPAFQHSLNFMYSRFNQETFSSLMCGVRGTLTKDALVNNSIYDESGKLYQQTVNAKALPWNIGGDIMFNIPFAQKMLQFHSRTSLTYNQRLAYLSREHTAAEIATWIDQGLFALGDESKTGNLNLREDLNLRFTHDIVDLGVRGNFTYSRTENSMHTSSVSNVFEWTVTGDVEFHLPKQWSIAADCGYTDRHGFNLSGVSELLLNASITKSWTNATLKLSAYDLLNNRKNIQQVIGENYVKYEKFNTLPTYAMLTFTYKLNKMGDLKAKGSAAFMQDMIESGVQPGQAPKRMPMAPPQR